MKIINLITMMLFILLFGISVVETIYSDYFWPWVGYGILCVCIIAFCLSQIIKE